jgi:hypothetical protein
LTDSLLSWHKAKVVRNKFIVDHNDTDDTKYIEDISIINEGDRDVVNLPLKLHSWLHGLEILDNDDSRISYYSKRQIRDYLGKCKAFLSNMENRYKTDVEADTKILNFIKFIDEADQGKTSSIQKGQKSNIKKIKDSISEEDRQTFEKRIGEKKTVLSEFRSISKQVRSLERHQKGFYLLWLRLPDERPIRPNEIRNIRLRYLIKNKSLSITGSEVFGKLKRSLNNVKRSFNYAKRSIQNNHSYLYDVKLHYHEIRKENEEHETEYIINSPKNCTVNIKKIMGFKMKADTDKRDDKQKILIRYRKNKDLSKDEHSSGSISIRAYSRYIFVRLPPSNEYSSSYSFSIEYTVDLNRIDKSLLYISIPITVVILLEIVLYSQPLPNILKLLSITLSKEFLVAFCATLGAVFGTLIALNQFPFQGRLRILLIIFIILLLYILTLTVKM